ncbi:MAG: secretin and TonB N-terminal domain-containing protein [Planctomycetes bacterium]|nr:secretin and TonB N-terminal domain-containing protein [Planctomycetota bacterium]
MSSSTRLALLGLFAAIGVGAAVCVVLATDLSLVEAAAEDDSVSSGKRANEDIHLHREPASLERSGQESLLDMDGRQPALVEPRPKQAQNAALRPHEPAVNQGQFISQVIRAALEAQADVFERREPAPVARVAQRPATPSGDSKFKDEGDDRLSFVAKDDDVRDVLELLGRGAGRNLFVSKSVQGNLSLSLTEVDFETALQQILRASGFQARQQGNVVYIGTPAEVAQLVAADDPITMRVYQPNYIRASELKLLLTPFITPEFGKIEVSSPALNGIASDSSNAEGDNYAGPDVVIIRDRESILSEIDQIVARVDRRPLQVAIEAVIISVKLDDEHQFGINFELLKNRANSRLISGTPPTSLAAISASTSGLKFGFLDSSLTAFISALEEIGDTNVIATPRLLCLNKHRAEIHIGEELGYVSTSQTETSTVQSVDFLEVGTQLRIRPFISRDGMIRMEVHPELSTGTVTTQDGFTIPNKEVTQVTTNVMVRDGATVVIGGLISESLTTSNSQIPLLGSLPFVGSIFRQQTETTKRTELVILITPRIVYDEDMYYEGNKAATEFYRRQAVYANHMNPTGKRYLGKMAFRQAQDAWAVVDRDRALSKISRSIAFDPLNRAAIDLREDILAGNYYGDHTATQGVIPTEFPTQGGPLSPWLLNELRGSGVTPYAGPHPRDSGTPGPRWNIQSGKGR